MKKFIKLLSIFVFMLLAISLFACDCSGQKDNTKYELTLADAQKQLTLNVGDEYTITPQFTEGATLEWKSSDASIVSVDNGKLKALASGNVTITISLKEDSSKSVTVSVVVEAKAALNETPLETILLTFKNNDQLKTKGVVYGIISNGFYFADSEVGRIFVNMGSNWTSTVKVGDEVSLVGQFSYVNNFPAIKNASEVTVLSSNNDSKTSMTEATVDKVAALQYDQKTGSYGKVFLLTGLIDVNKANIYNIIDDAGNICWFNSQSNVAALADFVGKRVSLRVVVHNYEKNDLVWNVSFCDTKDDIIENSLSFEDICEMALEDINERVAKDLYGRIVLPSYHGLFNYIKYTWSVEENAVVSIDNNKATVNILPDDYNITLKVKVSVDEQSESYEYPVVFHGIVERSIASLKELQVDLSVVKVRGVVVGHARNQSVSIRSLVLMQPDTMETITIDFFTSGDITMTDEKYTSIKNGDEILVTAQYRLSDRPTIMNVIDIEVKSSDNSYVHDFDNAIVLSTEEDFAEYGKNYIKYVNKLVKIENPYLIFSTSTNPSDTNWVRFGWDSMTPDLGYGVDNNKHYFAFLIAAQNENLGGDAWYKTLDIPFTGKGAVQFPITIYAYGIYISDTYIAFVIPDQSCYVTSDAGQVEMFLKGTIQKTMEKGTFEFPKTHEKVTGEIAWTSDNAAINVETGEISPSETENIEVKLTATYTVDGEQYTLEFNVTVLKDAPLSVSELNATAKNEQKLKVSGIIVGYVSDGNTQEVRKGVIIMDPTTKDLALVCGLNVIGGTYGAYKDSNGNELKIGDEVQFVGVYYVDGPAIGSGPLQAGRHFLDVSADGSAKLLSSGNDTTFGEAQVVISNNEEMVEFAKAVQYGVLVKFVGTKENPICIGGSSTSLPVNIKVFMNKNAASNDETKYSDDLGSQTFTFKSDLNIVNCGGDEDWYKKLFGVDGPFVAPNGTNPPLLFVGELYAVVAFRTGSYYQMSIVNLEKTNITKIVAPENVGKELVKGIPSEVNAGAFTFELPDTSELVSGNIIWESNSELINLETQMIGYADSDTDVTLTAKFTVDGQEYTEDKVVKVLKATSKADVEALLFASFPTELAPGVLTIELLTTALDVTEISWSVNSEVVDLESKTVSTVQTDTVVTFTATYTVRGQVETSTKDVTVSSSVTLDDVKASLAYGIPESVVAGDLPFELVTSHESVTGEVTWVSSNDAIDLTNKKVAEIDSDLDVTLTASFTFKGNPETLEVVVKVLGPYAISYLSNITTEGVIRVHGVIVGYASDGNSTATRMGVILKDTLTNDLLIVTGISSLGGSYGAYKDSDGTTLVIGDEIFVKAKYCLTTPSESSISSIEIPDRRFMWVTADDIVRKLSSNNAITWDEEDMVTITSNDEMAAFANNLEHAKIIKIVGTAENPILIGGSGSKAPFNLKVLMNKSATTNDHTKYNGKTFSVKSDINAQNCGDDVDWYKSAFDGITGPFVAPKDGTLCHEYTGVMYVIVTFTTGTYYQMSVTNYSNWSLSPKN